MEARRGFNRRESFLKMAKAITLKDSGMDTQVQTWEANAYHALKVRGDSTKPRAKNP
jgi:hypothetical protein